MMSMEMERWRVYFENSGEDLWTVIDWALTIAAVNYPSELRLRRDGYAEKLFAPANYPLVSNNCEPSTRNEELHDLPETDAVTDVDPVKHVDPVEQEILEIKQQLHELNDSSDEEDIIRALRRLQQMEVTVENLEVTGIGRGVNDLKKHPSKRVKSVAKKLVMSWKDIVDKWMDKKQKTTGGDGQNEEGELIDDKTMKAVEEQRQNRMDLLSSSVSSITHSMQRVENGDDDDMFGCSPDERQVEDEKYNRNAPPSECSLYNTKLNGYRKDSGQLNSRPESTRTTMAGPSVRTVKAPASTSTTPLTTSRKPPTTTKPIPYSPECEKLEAAKRRLQEGYKQAASVKKQRTVQVMGLGEIPQEGHNRLSNPKTGFNSRKPGQR